MKATIRKKSSAALPKRKFAVDGGVGGAFGGEFGGVDGKNVGAAAEAVREEEDVDVTAGRDRQGS